MTTAFQRALAAAEKDMTVVTNAGKRWAEQHPQPEPTLFDVIERLDKDHPAAIEYAALIDLVNKHDALWMLLDDIDTAFDMFKPDIEGFEHYVSKKMSGRFGVSASPLMVAERDELGRVEYNGGPKVDYQDEARKLVRRMAEIDFSEGDSLCIELGGDGDNGEIMVEVLAKALEQRDEDDNAIPAPIPLPGTKL